MLADWTGVLHEPSLYLSKRLGVPAKNSLLLTATDLTKERLVDAT